MHTYRFTLGRAEQFEVGIYVRTARLEVGTIVSEDTFHMLSAFKRERGRCPPAHQPAQRRRREANDPMTVRDERILAGFNTDPVARGDNDENDLIMFLPPSHPFAKWTPAEVEYHAGHGVRIEIVKPIPGV